MKLPEIQTGGVQSLGRLSTALPGKMYRAQASAVQSFQNAMDTFGNLGIKIYEQNAAAEHSKLRTEYMDRMNAAQAAIEKEPYRQVLGPDGEPTGELVSRHSEILDEFNTAEKRIRNEVMAKSRNSLAFRKLTEDLNQGGIAYRERTRTTAAQWAVNDASRSFRESFRINIANNNFKAAEQDLVAAVKVGAVSPTEQNRFALEILAKRQYRTGELLIEGITAETYTLKRVHELHRVFDEGENYIHLTDPQKNALHSALNYKVQDMMAEDIAFTAEHFSIEDAEAGVLEYASRRWDQSGFSDERAYTSAIGHLWNVVNQRKLRNQKTQKEMDVDRRVMEIMAGGWADPKDSIDKQAMDIVLKIRTAENQAPEGSNLWIRTVGQQARTQGWIPPRAEKFIRGNLLHMSPDSDKGSVLAAARAVQYLDRHAGRSLDQLTKEDIATGLMIAELADAGVDDMTAFMKVRDGLERVDEATKRAREAAYNGEFSKNSYAALEERVKDFDPSWFSTAEIPQEMVERYDQLRRINYTMTGHKEVADNMAFNELIRTYGITERSGNRILERKPPEAVKTDAPPEKVVEYIEDEWEQILEELDLDRENVIAVYKLDNSAEDSWYVYNVEKGEVVTDTEGRVLKWKPQYQTSRVGQRDRLETEYQRIQEEIEVERERQAYDAKLGLYEKFPADMTMGERIERDIRLEGDAIAKGTRKAAAATGEFLTEDVPEFWRSVNRASQERGKEEARARKQLFDRHERMLNDITPDPGSKLEQKIRRLQTIRQELEALE